MVARKYAEKQAIDPAMAEDYAHERLMDFARLYSTLNGPKFTTYANNCLSVAMARWCQDDRAGGMAAKFLTGFDSPRGDHPGVLESAEGTDRSPGRIDAADTLRKAKAGMTAEEWAELERYARGESREKPDGLILKAQRLIQGGKNRPCLTAVN